MARKLSYLIATTVDGFIASPDGRFDFFPMEGDHIAALASELPETLPKHVRAMLKLDAAPARFDTVLMGRGTYEPALSAGIAHPYDPLDTWVFSRTLTPKDEGGLHITADDPVAVVRALKAKPGRDLWLCGGADLAGQLVGEIDELVVKVNPVLAGEGVPLVRCGFHPRMLKLQSQRVFSSGVLWLTYDVVRVG